MTREVERYSSDCCPGNAVLGALTPLRSCAACELSCHHQREPRGTVGALILSSAGKTSRGYGASPHCLTELLCLKRRGSAPLQWLFAALLRHAGAEQLREEQFSSELFLLAPLLPVQEEAQSFLPPPPVTSIPQLVPCTHQPQLDSVMRCWAEEQQAGGAPNEFGREQTLVSGESFPVWR